MLNIEINTENVPASAVSLMEEVAAEVARLEGIHGVGAVVSIEDNDSIHERNLQYRNVDSATDVLSFPTINYPEGTTAKDNAKRIEREYDPDEGFCNLGFIAISIDRAREQAAEFNHSLAREIGYLTCHAMLHLCGYDHIEESDRVIMRAHEEEVMKNLGLNRAAVTDKELFGIACDMLEKAYVPYSHFKVGACLLTKDGRTFTGCNIENASYGATNCAERTAIFKAVSEGFREFEAIAIAGENTAPMPCGICRRVMCEFADPSLRIIVGKKDGSFTAYTLADLLPNSFTPKDLI